MLILISCLTVTAFSSMIEGKNETMSTSHLSGGARINYIFQSIFVKCLEVSVVNLESLNSASGVLLLLFGIQDVLIIFLHSEVFNYAEQACDVKKTKIMDFLCCHGG